MTTTTQIPTTAGVAPRRSRLVALRLLAGAAALVMALTGGHLLATGWGDAADGGVHRLQDLFWGVDEALLLAVPLALQLRRPARHPGAARVALLAVLAQLVGAVAAATIDPFGLVLLAFVVGVVALHPRRREVLRPRVRVDLPLLVLAVPASAGLLAFAVVQVAHHYAAGPGDVLEAKVGWLGAALCCLGLASVVLVSALLSDRTPALLAAAGLAVLGGASVLHPHLPSSLGVLGGSAALVGAAVAASRAYAVGSERPSA
ncbi:hypothetical protein [Motilibacter rhizosphaerae]|uniref:hypothetical protein n=1 Tax=Motilibacter rhizosphaerae TaxID=598652 RepID=UPI00102D24E7|nr:hypothetical protein [Motilibacter rhizosphaerae]